MAHLSDEEIAKMLELAQDSLGRTKDDAAKAVMTLIAVNLQCLKTLQEISSALKDIHRNQGKEW